MASKSSPYLTTLTPLRGIAAILVALFHINRFYRPFLPPGHTQFLDLSWLWVDFFFILSGFIMCYVYGEHFNTGVRLKPFKEYIGARFARIYPLLFITTLAAFICALFIVPRTTSLDPGFAEMFDRKAVVPCLLLIQSMHIGYVCAPLNNPAWSLSTEWWTYMIFPFFMPYFSRLKSTGKWLTLLALIGFYAIIKFIEHTNWGQHGTPPNMITDFGFIRCLACFFTGMLLFTFYQHRNGYNILRKSWFFAVTFLTLIVALHLGINHMLIILLFPFMLIAAAYNQGLVKRFLDTKPLQRLGDWSFSIYLIHFPVIFFFYIFDAEKDPNLFSSLDFFNRPPDYVHALIMCGVILTITLLLSALTYRYVEIPARNYFKKAFKTKLPRVNPETYNLQKSRV
jgi:peptidoglycan/LPS O-acetylase OafA/YrhL